MTGKNQYTFWTRIFIISSTNLTPLGDFNVYPPRTMFFIMNSALQATKGTPTFKKRFSEKSP